MASNKLKEILDYENRYGSLPEEISFSYRERLVYDDIKAGKKVYMGFHEFVNDFDRLGYKRVIAGNRQGVWNFLTYEVLDTALFAKVFGDYIYENGSKISLEAALKAESTDDFPIYLVDDSALRYVRFR
jgi:hypothetical protein